MWETGKEETTTEATAEAPPTQIFLYYHISRAFAVLKQVWPLTNFFFFIEIIPKIEEIFSILRNE